LFELVSVLYPHVGVECSSLGEAALLWM